MLFLALALAFFIFVAWMSQSKPPAAVGKTTEIRYRSHGTLLTQAEQRFHSVLRQSLPDHLMVCPKVGLKDFLACEHGRFNQSLHNKISQKHVDFLLVHKVSSRIVMAMELDDRSHKLLIRQERDAFVDQALASAGVPLIRVPAAGSYDPEEIRALLDLEPEPQLQTA